MSQRNNDNNECSNANQDYHGILVNLLARLNTQEFADTLAKAFVRANQNAAATTPLLSNSNSLQLQQPQPAPTALSSRLKAKLKRRARLEDEAADVDDEVDNQSASDYDDDVERFGGDDDTIQSGSVCGVIDQTMPAMPMMIAMPIMMTVMLAMRMMTVDMILRAPMVTKMIS